MMASTEHGKLERDQVLSLLESLGPLVSEWDLRVRLELVDPQGQQVIQASQVIPVRQARLALPDLLALRVQRVLLALLERASQDLQGQPETSQDRSAPPVSAQPAQRELQDLQAQQVHPGLQPTLDQQARLGGVLAQQDPPDLQDLLE